MSLEISRLVILQFNHCTLMRARIYISYLYKCPFCTNHGKGCVFGNTGQGQRRAIGHRIGNIQSRKFFYLTANRV